MRTALLLLLSLLTPLAYSQSGPERTLFQLINQSRAESQLPPLAWDPALGRAAKLHAAKIAGIVGVAEHQYPGEPDLQTRATMAGAKFVSIAENVAGSAPSADIVHKAWMMSPGHRRNILNPGYNAVGIAIAEDHGALFSVADFAHASTVTNSVAAEKQVQELLRDHNIKLEASNQAQEDARRNCESGATPQSHPILIMQWEASDFTQLPRELLDRLPAKSAKPQTAAVASCAAQKPTPGFTAYRVAVLIY
jgi:hypothetical protein